MINAYHTIEKGAAPYGSTVNFINGLIEYQNNLISNRGQGEEVPSVPAYPEQRKRWHYGTVGKGNRPLYAGEAACR
jgi:hypothetical protein